MTVVGSIARAIEKCVAAILLSIILLAALLYLGYGTLSNIVKDHIVQALNPTTISHSILSITLAIITIILIALVSLIMASIATHLRKLYQEITEKKIINKHINTIYDKIEARKIYTLAIAATLFVIFLLLTWPTYASTVNYLLSGILLIIITWTVNLLFGLLIALITILLMLLATMVTCALMIVAANTRTTSQPIHNPYQNGIGENFAPPGSYLREHYKR